MKRLVAGFPFAALPAPPAKPREDTVEELLKLAGGGTVERTSDVLNPASLQIAASRWTVSGYFLTRLIRRAACAFGLARPCSQFSRVRTLVRR